MKKFLITIIVLLVVLALGQAIYYHMNPPLNTAENISSLNLVNDFAEEDYPLDTANELTDENHSFFRPELNKVYDNYNPKITYESLKNELYTFINTNSPEILKNIYNKNVEGIKQYYEENMGKIQNMHIYQEEEFISIAKQLQNIHNNQQEIVDIKNYEIDTDSITYMPNGIINFDITFYYDDGITLKVKFILSENDEDLVISSASSLDKVFENYSGSVKKSDFLSKFESFIQNVEKIRRNSSLKTENEKMEYFDLNKDALSNIGIYSQEDYITITNQVNTMKWKYQDISFVNFEADKESVTTDANYINFIMKLYYSYDSEMDINVKLKINNSNDEPSIKFSGVIKEES